MPSTHPGDTYPVASRRFDLLALFFAAWTLLGGYVDVNAHNHGQVDDTFLTPWHLLLYSGVAANGLFLGIAHFRNTGRGYPWRRALPEGYFLSLIGVFVFLVGGGFDFIWHELFGFEQSIEALLSPAHLWLATGGVLFMSGPLRAIWKRAGASGWGELFPAIASATLVISLYTMFAEYSHSFSYITHYLNYLPGAEEAEKWDTAFNTFLVSGVLIPAAIYMGFILLLMRRWQLPVGTVSFILLVNSALVFWLYWERNQPYPQALIAALIGGGVGDALLARYRPGLARPFALHCFSFAVPFAYFLAFFAILILTEGLWWTIHMWLGVSFLAGIIGLSLSYLIRPYANQAAQ